MPLDDAIAQLTQLAAELTAIPGVVAAAGPAIPSEVRLRDRVTDPDLLKVSERLFEDGHHARSVEEAFKYLNNLVKARTGLASLDGSGLMKTALSANNPKLKLNAGTTQSERDEQLGYMEICAGSMTGIRNPRAHEHDWEDAEEHAVQMLVLADHLVGRVKTALKSTAES
jgi:uncharacterized protein (TIGR02391 family)